MAQSGVEDTAILERIRAESHPPVLLPDDFVDMAAAGVSKDVLNALNVRVRRAFTPVPGSGVQWHIKVNTLEMTSSQIYLRPEGDGFWQEMRNITNFSGVPGRDYKNVSKVFMSEDLKPKKQNAAAPKDHPGLQATFKFLQIFLDVAETAGEARRARLASMPIHNDAERLQEVSRMSNRPLFLHGLSPPKTTPQSPLPFPPLLRPEVPPHRDQSVI